MCVGNSYGILTELAKFVFLVFYCGFFLKYIFFLDKFVLMEGETHSEANCSQGGWSTLHLVWWAWRSVGITCLLGLKAGSPGDTSCHTGMRQKVLWWWTERRGCEGPGMGKGLVTFLFILSRVFILPLFSLLAMLSPEVMCCWLHRYSHTVSVYGISVFIPSII